MTDVKVKFGSSTKLSTVDKEQGKITFARNGDDKINLFLDTTNEDRVLVTDYWMGTREEFDNAQVGDEIFENLIVVLTDGEKETVNVFKNNTLIPIANNYEFLDIDINDFETGEANLINADTLDGHGCAYFATAETVDTLRDEVAEVNSSMDSMSDTLVASASISGSSLIFKNADGNTIQSLTLPAGGTLGLENNLTSTSTTKGLAAAQGKVLNEKFANYLPLTGGTLGGGLKISLENEKAVIINDGGIEIFHETSPFIDFHYNADNSVDYSVRLICISPTSLQVTGDFYANTLYGGVFNDYAEFRSSGECEPGRCVIETGDGTLIRSTERLQRGAEIISDTYGFAIGETKECKTPIAVTGRVLAYPYEDISKFKPGYPVCSGPNGTVSIMTEEEEQMYPSRIIGTVSEIPSYDTWGTKNIKVNKRVWIRIK